MQKKSIACIAVIDKKILIAHRKNIGDMAERWEFPGGKVEEGESDSTAIIREMREEFGVEVEPKELITQAAFMHSGKQVSLSVYHVNFPHSGKGKDPPFILTEHTGYAWVKPDEIRDLEFVDSDYMIFPIIENYVARL